MHSVGRAGIAVPFLLAVVLASSAPAFAQIDFTGVWNGNTNSEDGPDLSPRASGRNAIRSRTS
jgi:hypothetical protein